MARPRVYDRSKLDLCRDKIKTSQLINRLVANALGEITLDANQIRSIEILLRKSLPDLSAVEMHGEVANYVARLPQPAKTAEDWIASVRPTEARTATEDQASGTEPVKH